MSIKEKLAKIKKHPRNYKYYNNKFEEEDGYYIVPVTSLSSGSKVIITKICDNCGEEKRRPFKDVLKNRKNGKDFCWKCGNNTPEAKINKSNSHKGYMWSDESKLRASKTHTGVKHSKDTIAKIKASVKEKTNSEEWKKWIRKYNYETYSLDAYIKKYGESEGEKLFKIERKSKSPWCFEYWLVKHSGNADLAKKSLHEYQKRDLSYFKKIYGENEGEDRYKQWNIAKLYNNKNRYSKSSQVFIKDFIETYNMDNTHLYYGDEEWIFYLTDEERKVFDYKKRLASVDFYDRKNNIVIEYDGDYWHSSDEQKFYDQAQDLVLEKKGIKTIRIKESKYLNNKKDTIKEIIKIYEDYKN